MNQTSTARTGNFRARSAGTRPPQAPKDEGSPSQAAPARKLRVGGSGMRKLMRPTPSPAESHGKKGTDLQVERVLVQAHPALMAEFVVGGFQSVCSWLDEQRKAAPCERNGARCLGSARPRGGRSVVEGQDCQLSERDGGWSTRAH